jgi:hypothetical protein
MTEPSQTIATSTPMILVNVPNPATLKASSQGIVKTRTKDSHKAATRMFKFPTGYLGIDLLQSPIETVSSFHKVGKAAYRLTLFQWHG